MTEWTNVRLQRLDIYQGGDEWGGGAVSDRANFRHAIEHHTSKKELEEAVEALLLDHERLTRERQALLVLWQDGPSLPDCHACAVVGAALRGEGEK